MIETKAPTYNFQWFRSRIREHYKWLKLHVNCYSGAVRICVLENTISDWNLNALLSLQNSLVVLENTISDWNEPCNPFLPEW